MRKSFSIIAFAGIVAFLGNPVLAQAQTQAPRAPRAETAPGVTRAASRAGEQADDDTPLESRDVDSTKPATARDPQKLAPQTARDDQRLAPATARDPQDHAPETARDDQRLGPQTARDPQDHAPETARDDPRLEPEDATDPLRRTDAKKAAVLRQATATPTSTPQPR